MDMPTPDELPGDIKLAGDIVNAAQDTINKVSDLLPDETRGIVIQISNLTGLTLGLKTSDFSSGGVVPDALPAPFIGPFSQTVFGVKSTGLATGVIGSVTYESDGIDVLLCGFDNPFIGSNAVNVTLTGARADSLSCRAVIGSGNHTAANFVLLDTGGFASGDKVNLICLGSIAGARYLDGRTVDGTVGLAPNGNFPFTGATWEVDGDGNGGFVLKCLGNIDGPRFLDGRTANATTGLAPATNPPFTGTHWQVNQLGTAAFSLRCLGNIDGPRFLDGRTGNGTVGLAPSTDPAFSGTHWAIFRR
jgi:hypothetical protein